MSFTFAAGTGGGCDHHHSTHVHRDGNGTPQSPSTSFSHRTPERSEGSVPTDGPGTRLRHLRDLDSGDVVTFHLYDDQAVWKRTADVLRVLSLMPHPVVTRLPASTVVAGRAEQQDPYRHAVFESRTKFPDMPYVIVTEEGDCTLEDVAGQSTWQQPSRIAFVCNELAQALVVLQSQGLVHTNLCAANCHRFYDGSWRLAGAEHMYRLGETVSLEMHWEVCPPEHAVIVLSGGDRPVSVDNSIQMWALGALLYRLATGTMLATDLSDGTATTREECLSVLASLHKSPLGQSKVEALLSSMDQRMGALRGPAARIPRYKMVVDVLKRLLLRVENWQRCSVEKLLEHPLLSGHGVAGDPGPGSRTASMGPFGSPLPSPGANKQFGRAQSMTLWSRLQHFLELHWQGVDRQYSGHG